MRSKVTQTDRATMVAKTCQAEAGVSRSKLRHQRIDSVSPISYASRSASTLSSSAAPRNLNHTQNTLNTEQDRTKNPAFLQSMQAS